MESKLPSTGTTIFTVMSQLSAECGAINLSQGFPEFEPDPELLALVEEALHGGANQYAPMTGIPSLRQAIAEKVESLYGRAVDAEDEITVCSGATEGLFSAIHACVRRDDEVIVLDPAYDSYEPAVTLAGGTTRHVPLASTPARPDPHMDWMRLADTINARTRLLILNFPHNPSGAILTGDDLDELAGILRDTGTYLLSDEVYEHIVFDGRQHESLLRHDELWERSFVVSSFGKTYHATGWKVGYCVAPSELSKEFRQIHQWNTFATSTPMQHAIAAFMAARPEHYEQLARFYEQKRDLFCELLADSQFRFRKAAGTFFQMLDYSAISSADDVEYSRELTKNAGVASIPVSVFCEKPPAARQLRFCFAKNDETLQKAAEKLCRL